MRKEDNLQISCVKWFKYQHPGKMITSFPAGYVFSGDKIKRARTGKRMKDMGYMNGIPDIFIPHPSGCYHGLFIELKMPGNNPNLNQRETIHKLMYVGYKCAVCKTVDEFINTINEYFTYD